MSTEARSKNPYVGPCTFKSEDSDFFFGREREARDLLARVVSEHLLLFYAQSGAGKSSLLYTRLIPRLQEDEGFVVLPVGRVGGELPAGVEQVDNIYAFNLMLSIDAASDPAQLAHVTLSDFLARRPPRTVTDATGEEQRYALIIDQFEEIITAHPGRWQEREDFLRQLNQAMQKHPNLWAVLALREDYVAALDPYAPLMTNQMRARFYMERMGLDAALEAIRRPAEAGGRPFAPDVAERLRDDLCQVREAGREGTVPGQYVEPVQLQVVCYQLWENIKGRPSGPITAEDLAEAGDVNQALSRFYEKTLQEVLAEPPAIDVGERQLRAWFDEELITEEGTRALVRQGREATGSLPNTVVDRLQKRFLVHSETRSGDTGVELVHDRFVGPIRQSNRDWFARNLNPLTQAAKAWQEAGKPESKLYVGSQLAAADAQLKKAKPGEFGDLEREFVDAGLRIEAQKKVQEQRRRTGILAAVVAVLAVLSVVAVWFALDARTSGRLAQVAKTSAEAAQAAEAAQRETAEHNAELAMTQEAKAQVAKTTAEAAQAAEAAQRAAAVDNLALALTRRAEVEVAKEAAEAARIQAVAERTTAEAAVTAAAVARVTLEISLQAAVTAEAAARQTAVAVNLAAAVAQAVTGTPPPNTVGTPTPTATPTATPAGTCRTLRPVALREGPGLAYPEVGTVPKGQQLGVLARSGAPVLGVTSLVVRTPDGQTGWVLSSPGDLDCSGVELGRVALVSLPPRPTPNPSVVAQQTQLAQVRATQTALAPPSGRIVFASNRGPNPNDLYIMAPDGSGQRQFSFNGAAEPSYTAGGGNLLAFASERPLTPGKPEDLFSVYVMPVGGGSERRITDFWDDFEPSLAPNGQQMAITSTRHNLGQEIWILNPDGSEVRRLTNEDPARSGVPSWSPKGDWIAYASEMLAPGGGTTGDGTKRIWLIPPTGGTPRRLTKGSANENWPAWSPDGRRIVFISDLSGNRDVWVIDADGKNARNLTNTKNEDEKNPVFSLDGKWIAFTRVVADPESKQEIFLMRADGSDARNLTRNPAEDFEPTWVP